MKEKRDYADLYKRRGKEDERNALRVAVENLHDKTELNSRRINDLVNRYHELYNDISKFKRHIINKEENK
tara:strand:+ start:1048 stop:1257 length:210 start_codon:yes stop_codon:yes gene_type:complete